MKIFKRIKGWFQNTKPGLRWRINKLTSGMHNLEEGIKSLEQDLWKERKFKEDYRDRLTRYYDECIELRKKLTMTRGRFYYISDNLFNWAYRNRRFFNDLLAMYLTKMGITVYTRKIKKYNELDWSKEWKHTRLKS